MKQGAEHRYITPKVNTFLNIDKKMYAGIFAVLLFYLGACIVAFVDYILNGVDFVHISAVIFLFALGVIPGWILWEGWYLSKQAVLFEESLSTVDKGVISWKTLSKICGRKNSVRLLNRMIRRGFIDGVRINIERKAIVLEENYRSERRNR